MAEVWPFEPEKMSVKLEWFTSVLQSRTTEQRSKIRQLYPRAVFKITSFLTDTETMLARSIVRRANGDYLLPDWRYSSRVFGTFGTSSLDIAVDDNYFYPVAGDQGIAWQSVERSIPFTINTRGANTLAALLGPPIDLLDFQVMPLLSAISIGDIAIKQGKNNVNSVTITLQTQQYKDLASFATSYPSYLTYEVNTTRDISQGSNKATILRVMNLVDGKTGQVSQESRFDHVDEELTLSSKAFGQAAMISQEGWVHKRYGRLVPFWKPTWGSDLTITADASAAATTLTAVANGSPADYINRHFIVDQGGSFSYFKVVAAHDDASGYGYGYGTGYGGARYATVLTLTLSAGLTDAIVVANITTVSELTFARFDADKISFKYAPGVSSRINVPIAGLSDDI